MKFMLMLAVVMASLAMRVVQASVGVKLTLQHTNHYGAQYPILLQKKSPHLGGGNVQPHDYHRSTRNLKGRLALRIAERSSDFTEEGVHYWCRYGAKDDDDPWAGLRHQPTLSNIYCY